ncbi:MAG: pyridoxal-phosphate dependent enzyme [Immundisolibacteraceae bacterium]|nr:pyridoxal-phosphate dependent enzyme [Immundisolibacteraceae bacterium]
MQPLHIPTPLLESLALSQLVAPQVWLKMDALQPSGSFKIRGIGHACQHYLAQGAGRFLASSAGNAGLAVAYAGRKLGVPVTVVVPTTTKPRAIELIEQEGAQVVINGEDWDAADAHAHSLRQPDWAYIHPFDDPLLWQGHASLIDEIAADGFTPDGIVVAVGGGGLMNGVAQGLDNHGWNTTPILAVETVGTDSLYAASQAGKHVGIDHITSIATSLGARKVAARSFDLLQTHSIECHRVTDRQAVEACYRFLRDHRVMVEPACGAALATVYQQAEFFTNKENVVVIVCGGVGVTLERLAEWRDQLA